MKSYVFEDDPQTLNIRLNIGMTGFGKSSLLRYQLGRILVLNRSRSRDRIILVDPSVDDFHFKNFGAPVETAAQAQRIIGSGELAKFHLKMHTRSVEVFDYLCWEAHRQGDVFLVVDEIWNFIPTKAGSAVQPESFNLLITESRHVRARILGTAQRPSQIHNNLLNLAQEVNIFRTEDLELVKNKLVTKENRLRARSLQKFEMFSCRNGEPVLCSIPKN